MNLISARDYNTNYRHSEGVHQMLMDSEAGRSAEYHKKKILENLTMDQIHEWDKGREEALKDPYKGTREVTRKDIRA